MALSRLSPQSRASFFLFSLGRSSWTTKERVGSGCCINAATVLAVIDSRRKAAVEGRARVRGREGRENLGREIGAISTREFRIAGSDSCGDKIGSDRIGSYRRLCGLPCRARERKRYLFKGPSVFTVPRESHERFVPLVWSFFLISTRKREGKGSRILCLVAKESIFDLNFKIARFKLDLSRFSL